MSILQSGSRAVLRASIFLATILVLPLSAQKITFDSIPPNDIEARLKKAPANNQARFDTLKGLFTEAGCKQLSEQEVKDGEQPNLICTLPGSGPATVVVGAHFDSGAKGEGIINNWAGAALLPALYRSLNSSPRKITFQFVGFSGKEKGLAGSKAYVKALTKEQQRAVKAMVDIDCVGMTGLRLIVNKSDKSLVNMFARVAASMKVPLTATEAEQGEAKDSFPFSGKRIPSIEIHSLGLDQTNVPNSEKDTMAAVNLDDYKATARVISGFLAFLDATAEAAPAAAGGR